MVVTIDTLTSTDQDYESPQPLKLSEYLRTWDREKLCPFTVCDESDRMCAIGVANYIENGSPDVYWKDGGKLPFDLSEDEYTMVRNTFDESVRYFMDQYHPGCMKLHYGVNAEDTADQFLESIGLQRYIDLMNYAASKAADYLESIGK